MSNARKIAMTPWLKTMFAYDYRYGDAWYGNAEQVPGSLHLDALHGDTEFYCGDGVTRWFEVPENTTRARLVVKSKRFPGSYRGEIRANFGYHVKCKEPGILGYFYPDRPLARKMEEAGLDTGDTCYVGLELELK